MGIFQTVDMYKVQHKVASIEDLRDLLANKIDDRYKADVSKASTGFKKFLTGDTADMLIIKKNGYHGMAITIDPYQEDRGYAIISMVPVTPNAMIEWLTRKAGILDKLVFNAIWGSPKAFRTNVEGSIIQHLKAEKVDNSMGTTIKNMFTGKSMFDSVKNVKNMGENLIDSAENLMDSAENTMDSIKDKLDQ